MEADPLEAAKMFSELSEQGHPFAQVKVKMCQNLAYRYLVITNNMV